MLVARSGRTGNQLRIADIKEKVNYYFDSNHVLAGQDLTFELELVAYFIKN